MARTGMQLECGSYPYGASASGRYRLSRDGAPIMVGTEIEVWQHLHRETCASVEHALRHEGWKIEAEEAPALSSEPASVSRYANAERSEGHEGWSNRETWAVAYAIDNTERELDAWTSHARNWLAQSDTTFAKDGLSGALRDYFEDEVEAQLDGADDMVTVGLLEASLLRVNWRELAEHYLEMAREQSGGAP